MENTRDDCSLAPVSHNQFRLQARETSFSSFRLTSEPEPEHFSISGLQWEFQPPTLVVWTYKARLSCPINGIIVFQSMELTAFNHRTKLVPISCLRQFLGEKHRIHFYCRRHDTCWPERFSVDEGQGCFHSNNNPAINPKTDDKKKTIYNSVWFLFRSSCWRRFFPYGIFEMIFL